MCFFNEDDEDDDILNNKNIKETPLFIHPSKDIFCAIRNQCRNGGPISMGEFLECKEYNKKNCENNSKQPLLSFNIKKYHSKLNDKDNNVIDTVDNNTNYNIGNNSICGSIFTLTNTILGSGTLAVPFAIASSGYILGILIMIFIAYVTRYSVHLLLLSSEKASKRYKNHSNNMNYNKNNKFKTYESLGHFTMGQWGTKLAEFTFIFGGFGTLISYFIFITSLFSSVLNIKKENQWLFMCFFTFMIIMPLSLNRKLGKLQITSILATFSVIFVVLFIISFSIFIFYYSFNNEITNVPFIHSPMKPIHITSGSIYTITLLIGAFACHNTVLPVFDELRRPSIKRMNKAVHGAIMICFFLYFMIGMCGYYIFRDTTKDNILLNFNIFTNSNQSFIYQYIPYFHILLSIGQICMGIALLLTCPVALWPFRSCLLSVYLRIKYNKQMESKNASKIEFISITIISECIILLFSIFIPNVKIPLSIVGSVSGSLIIFIMPSLFYLLQKDVSLLTWKNRGPLFMLIIGIIIGVNGFSITMYKIYEENVFRY